MGWSAQEQANLLAQCEAEKRIYRSSALKRMSPDTDASDVSPDSPHLKKYKPLPGKELYERWINSIAEWSQLILRRASPPTYEELNEEHEKIWESEWQIIHELQNSIKLFDFMRRVKRKQPDLKEGAEWLIKTIDEHRELRKVALMYRKWVDQKIGPMDKAKDQLTATIPWEELSKRGILDPYSSHFSSEASANPTRPTAEKQEHIRK